MAREHDARQPFTEEELLDALKGNVCTSSYRQLAKHVNGWCAAATVETWLKSHESYHLYAKNIKPGLTEENRAKQVSFSKRVHNLWGLDVARNPKILWIMCDEKWFSGLVPRTNAKACTELGTAKESYSAHHKKHIAKVMVHCTVGFCFNGNVEYGGDGFLIGAHRCAAFQVPQRDIYYSSKDPVTGRTVFKGNKIKHAKGQPYLVDCNVTGSNAGTAYSPNFPLRKLWEHSLIPSVKALIAPDGPCAGATVVFQEDNAGPHTEKEYSAWMQTTFNELGWHIELQAPQGKFEYDTVLCTRLLLYVFLLYRSLYQRARPISIPIDVAPA
jgi:hypothetical protein